MFNDVKKQAYEQFKLAVNQDAIERMADDVHVYERQSPELDRLEQLAEIFHEYGNPATLEFYRTMRGYSLRLRDVSEFMALTDCQYNWDTGSDGEHSHVFFKDHKKPALRVVNS